ncbi:MAG TPA: HlyD family efflux transporter periplasmic adaptor subunit [Desulfobulbaceae bacterium]|nr:HlyD family efflux transporter periplasmic adaptor subunit [Desulfobulbaceae bacterium]
MNAMNTYKIFILTLLFFLPGRLYAETYPVATARQGVWQQEVTAFGRVSALAETALTLPFAIKVTETKIQPGDTVVDGQVLLRFQSPAFIKNISEYATSRRLFLLGKKQQKILRQGIREHTLTRRDVLNGSKQSLKSEAELERSWNQVHTDLMLLGKDIKRKELDVLLNDKTPSAVAKTLSVLRAPFSGTILNTPPTAGQWIQANSPVLSLEDLHKVYVTIALSEKMAGKWTSGQTFIQDKKTDIQLHPVPGTARIDAANGLRLFVFTADNPNNSLGDGQWIRVMHSSPEKQVIWVPTSAVVSRNNQSWCIVKNNKNYIPIRIEAVAEKDGKIPVLSGLKAGQQVVCENAYELLYRDLKELIKFVD